MWHATTKGTRSKWKWSISSEFRYYAWCIFFFYSRFDFRWLLLPMLALLTTPHNVNEVQKFCIKGIYRYSNLLEIHLHTYLLLNGRCVQSNGFYLLKNFLHFLLNCHCNRWSLFVLQLNTFWNCLCEISQSNSVAWQRKHLGEWICQDP